MIKLKRKKVQKEYVWVGIKTLQGKAMRPYSSVPRYSLFKFRAIHNSNNTPIKGVLFKESSGYWYCFLTSVKHRELRNTWYYSQNTRGNFNFLLNKAFKRNQEQIDRFVREYPIASYLDSGTGPTLGRYMADFEIRVTKEFAEEHGLKPSE